MIWLDGEKIAEGQEDNAVQREEVYLLAFLTADLLGSVASIMAAE